MPHVHRIRKALPAGAAVIAAFATIGATSAPALADATGSGSSSQSTSSQAAKPKLSMSQAEQIASTTFSIPSDYTLQNQSFNDNTQGNEPPSYAFDYQQTQQNQPSGYVNVTINANTGTVMSYYQSSGQQQFTFPVPTSAAQAQQIAEQWAKKLFPDQASQVKELPAQPQYGSLRQPVTYTYNFERMVNNIPAPFDGFSIQIDQNGNLTSVQDHWTSLSFPDASKAVGSSAAGQAYANDLNLYLAYTPVYSQDAQPKTELTYQPSPEPVPSFWNDQYSDDQSIQGPVIDALTGKAIDALGRPITSSNTVTPTPLDAKGPTAPANLPKVNWDEDQALAFATKVLNIPSSAQLTNENEYTSPDNGSTWNFAWTDGSNHINASVDATYGQLQNFGAYQDQSQPDGKNPSAQGQPKLSQSDINNTVDSFLKRVFAGETGSIAVRPMPEPPSPQSNGLQTNFQVEWLVNGVLDEARSGNINVDANTGEIQNYYMNVQQPEGTLPQPSQAISKSDAAQKWITARPLTLEYLETQPQYAGKFAPNAKDVANQSPQVFLTYAPVVSNGAANIFNAVDGKFESTDSTPKPFTGTIKDLDGVSSAAQIELLVQRELVTVGSDDKVHPEQTLTNGAFVKLLDDALEPGPIYTASASSNAQLEASHAAMAVLGSVPTNSPDFNEIVSAYELGWLPEGTSFQPNAQITRGQAAQIMARALGYDALLQHSDAFQLKADDASKLSGETYAAAALVTSLGVLPLQQGSFNADGSVTLADAAQAVVQMATLEPGSDGRIIHPLG